jgi:hypothetical protein
MTITRGNMIHYTLAPSLEAARDNFEGHHRRAAFGTATDVPTLMTILLKLCAHTPQNIKALQENPLKLYKGVPEPAHKKIKYFVWTDKSLPKHATSVTFSAVEVGSDVPPHLTPWSRGCPTPAIASRQLDGEPEWKIFPVVGIKVEYDSDWTITELV